MMQKKNEITTFSKKWLLNYECNSTYSLIKQSPDAAFQNASRQDDPPL